MSSPLIICFERTVDFELDQLQVVLQLLVVLSRFKLKKKKSQDQEEENRLCLSKLKCLELNPRTPGQIVETLQTI